MAVLKSTPVVEYTCVMIFAPNDFYLFIYLSTYLFIFEILCTYLREKTREKAQVGCSRAEGERGRDKQSPQ